MVAAEDIRALRTLRHLDLHALKGTHKGQHALRLDGFYRLIVTFRGMRPPSCVVDEVSKHYDD
jgi:plasmid maintenance system killer protein